MTDWSELAVKAAIKGWFGMWASDEARMLNALKEAERAQKKHDDYLHSGIRYLGPITVEDINKIKTEK